MSEFIKKIGEVDIERIISEFYNKVYNEYSIEPEQYSLQGFNEDDVDGAAGMTGDLKGKEKECTVRLYDNYEYSYSIIEEYKMYRSRLMMLPDKRNYSWHIDYSPRLHIPLITNDSCFFIIEDKKIHLPADGGVYWVDTTKWHTFVNANRHPFMRYHIVGCV